MKNYFLMFDVLKKYNFQFESLISLDITCVICKDLLKDACQGPCGCLYCLQCIENYLEGNNRKCCPGNSAYCSNDEIIFGVNINRDNSANRKIEKLRVKCPINSCEFRSELGEMCDHLKVCVKAELCCPYRDLGCGIVAIGDDELLEHVQQNCHQHNKMIISWMMNIRMELLAQKRLESLEMRISRILIDFTHENEKKQTVIDQLRDQLKSAKNDNKDLSKLVSQFQGEIFQLKNSISQHNETTDSAIHQLKSEIDSLKLTISPANQISKPVEMKSDWPVKLLPVKIEKSMKFSLADLDHVSTASFEWMIDDLNRIRTNRENLCSDWFNCVSLDYKMLLCLNPDLNRDRSMMQITFNVCDLNAASGRAVWPFSAHVKLVISNKCHEPKNASIHHQIDRHVNADNPITTLTVDPLCKFDFFYSDLYQIGIDISLPVVIQCAVDNFNCHQKH